MNRSGWNRDEDPGPGYPGAEPQPSPAPIHSRERDGQTSGAQVPKTSDGSSHPGRYSHLSGADQVLQFCTERFPIRSLQVQRDETLIDVRQERCRTFSEV